MSVTDIVVGNKRGNPVYSMPGEMKTILVQVSLYCSANELIAWLERHSSVKVKV